MFNEFQVPSQPDLDYWYQVGVLGYGPKLTYKLLRHAVVDNVTYDISGPSLPPLRSGLSPPNHSGMSENNKHAFRPSRDSHWRQICVYVASITNGMTQTQLKELWILSANPKTRTVKHFCFYNLSFKTKRRVWKGRRAGGWGWGESSQNMGFCQVRIDGAKY